MRRLARRSSLVAALRSPAAAAAPIDDDGDSGERQDARPTRVEVLEEPGGEGERARLRPAGDLPARGAGRRDRHLLFGGEGLDCPRRRRRRRQAASARASSLDGKGEIATNAHVVHHGEGDESGARARSTSSSPTATRCGRRSSAPTPTPTSRCSGRPGGLTLRPLPLGSRDAVQVGDAGRGDRHPVRRGPVAVGRRRLGLDRAIESLTDFQISGAIQTDAAINPGNSGGPLLDARRARDRHQPADQVRAGGGEGVGFAVPVDLVRRSLDAASAATGEVSYAYLGVPLAPAVPAARPSASTSRSSEGAWVQVVQPDGPGADAGLSGGTGAVRFQARTFAEGGDIIARIDDRPIRDPDDLSEAVPAVRSGPQGDRRGLPRR